MLRKFCIEIKQVIKVDKREFVILNYLMMNMMLLKIKLDLCIVNVFLMFVMKYILLDDL